MLSILIPIYNYDCMQLVSSLALQAQKENIDFEICCIDDYSTKLRDRNADIGNIQNCSYTQLDKNIGRSRIRNLLAENAKYENLLFLDCDSEVVSHSFIHNYLKHIAKYDVVSGGRIYTPNPPLEKVFSLHWKYGTFREPKPTDGQEQVFMSNNFLIRKAIPIQTPFNEAITRYGHEDSLFQLELKKQGIDILFINNPILHAGLDTNINFIRKTKEGVETLYELSKNNLLEENGFTKIKLLATYQVIKRYKLEKIFARLYSILENTFVKSLTRKSPNLRILDLYKLFYLAYIDRMYSL